jgi:hypothetical protein
MFSNAEVDGATVAGSSEFATSLGSTEGSCDESSETFGVGPLPERTVSPASDPEQPDRRAAAQRAIASRFMISFSTDSLTWRAHYAQASGRLKGVRRYQFRRLVI